LNCTVGGGDARDKRQNMCLKHCPLSCAVCCVLHADHTAFAERIPAWEKSGVKVIQVGGGLYVRLLGLAEGFWHGKGVLGRSAFSHHHSILGCKAMHVQGSCQHVHVHGLTTCLRHTAWLLSWVHTLSHSVYPTHRCTAMTVTAGKRTRTPHTTPNMFSAVSHRCQLSPHRCTATTLTAGESTHTITTQHQ
jgi:hypothetical protein